MSHVEVVARTNKVLLILAVFAFASLVFLCAPAAAAPVPPQDITVTAHSSFIDLSWVAPGEPDAAYSVWRATQVGDLALDARIIGFSSTTSFIDSTAIVGARYRYAIAELGAGADAPTAASFTGVHSLVPVDPAAALSPHRTESSTAFDITCARCHSLSEATSEVGRLIDHNGPYVSQAVMCTGCHAHASVRTGFEGGLSGHAIAFDSDPVAGGVELTCSQCHDAHGKTSDGNALSPKRIRRPDGALADVIWTDPVTNEFRPNALCIACHDLPTVSADFRPVFDPLYYPLSGTYPGADTYADPSMNVHAALVEPGVNRGPIAVAPGSCTHCHGPHRTDSPNDGLRGVGAGALEVPNAAPGDVSPLCARCHAWVMPSDEVTDTTSWGVHLMSTPGGVFEPGTSIPCYICHNAHGSSRGNTFNISDALGGNLDPVNAEREFCFTCHTTSQGLGWDSDSESYAAPQVDEVLGYSRTALEPGGVTGVVSKLRLTPFVDGPTTSDPHSSHYIGTATCGTCHGSVHAPALPDITKINCYDCHAKLLPMERTTASRAQSYHHILGDGVTVNIGGTPLASEYQPPTAENGFRQYCLTCHTGHTTLATAATNLKTSPTDPTPAASDYLGSPSAPGICLSCHRSAQVRNTKDPADQRKAFVRVPSGAEVNAVRAVSAVDYSTSPHRYVVPTATGGSGSCSKCHSAFNPTVDGTSIKSFDPHISSNRYLIDRIGDDSTSASWNATPGEYKLCFSCHARRGDIAQATPVGKEIAGRDWFNVTAMGTKTITYRYADGNVIGSLMTNSEMTFADMFKSTGVDLSNPIPNPTASGHRSEKVVSPSDTRFTAAYRAQTTSVRCTGCHDVHKSQLAASTVSGEWPLTKKAVPGGVLIWRNNLSSAGFSADGWRLITLNDYWNPPATRVDILCFKCHEASVAMSTLAHSSSDNVGKYGGDAGRDHKNSFIACVACHTPGVHGSGMPYLLADATNIGDPATRVMPPHQVMRWYNPRTLTTNDYVAKLVSVSPTDVKNPDRMGCSTATGYGCHTQLYSQWKLEGDRTGLGWVNWQ